MVKSWYMDTDCESDRRLEHHLNPPEYIELPELYKKTGVEYFAINPKTFNEDGVLEKIRKNRGYSFEDEICCSKDTLPNFEANLEKFYAEHLHTDEEIRFVVDGSGYFDVRDGDDRWIRIHVEGGDMIIIPSGIYHRFTLDTKNYIKAKRYFVGEPVWLPHNRPADQMECRKEYLKRLDIKFA